MSTTTSPSAQAQEMLYNGLTVTSSSTSSLNGVYACQGNPQQIMQQETNAIALTNAFADGSATINWPDSAGAMHSFTVAQFRTLVVAMAYFIAGCLQYASGSATALPPSTATIP